MPVLSKGYEPAAVEAARYARWLEAGSFRADPESTKPPYSIVIPPPNVTGVLTMGHVLNNTIQDILCRKARMDGQEVLWLPGTDHAGLATQTAVEKALRKPADLPANVRAVLEGLTIPRVLPDPAQRQELERQDAATLYARLSQLDPRAAAKIDPRNKRRVIRALEVCQAAGQPISALQTARAPNYRILRIGLTLPREQLYARINARVDQMIAAGLVNHQGVLPPEAAVDQEFFFEELARRGLKLVELAA